MVLSLTEAQTIRALGNFLTAILPAGTPIFKAQTNRVPEPAGTDFCSMTPIMRERLEWNTDSYGQDIETITFAALAYTPAPDDVLTNAALTASGKVISVTGLSVSLTPGASPSTYFAIGDVISDGIHAVGTVTGIAYGAKSVLTPTKVTVQLDVHGPISADNAALISSLFFDAYATEQFATSGFAVFPLYASEPKQIPFSNAESQIEERWVVDVALQCNPVTTVPVQYGTQIAVNVALPL